MGELHLLDHPLHNLLHVCRLGNQMLPHLLVSLHVLPMYFVLLLMLALAQKYPHDLFYIKHTDLTIELLLTAAALYNVYERNDHMANDILVMHAEFLDILHNDHLWYSAHDELHHLPQLFFFAIMIFLFELALLYSSLTIFYPYPPRYQFYI